MKTTFSHSEVFPLVARLIVRLAKEADGSVGHRMIVSALIGDPEGAEVIERAKSRTALPDADSVASNMVAWFSQQISVGQSPWADFFVRERREGAWAYTPITTLAPTLVSDAELAAVEGDPRLFVHFRRERDRALTERKRKTVLAEQGRLACEACGLVSEDAYPGLQGDVLEVHHRILLAADSGSVETHLDDLALLCANCHRAIHRETPLMSVEAFRASFFAEGAS